MSLENKESHESFENVEVALGRAEQFVETNKKVLLYAVGGIIVLIILFIGAKKFYFQPREQEAQSQMFSAERYFEKDSFNLALNGDANYPGFLGIIDQYGMTDAANLAHYYAGISYLHLGKFDEAVKHLKKFSSKDIMIGAIAKGAMGDAYLEQGKKDDAINQYLSAAKKGDNDFIAPIYLMKAAQVYEADNNYNKSLELYQTIQKDYPLSTEGRQIEKYITRANMKLQTK